MKGKRNIKVLALTFALVLLVGGVVGGTIAWLIDKSDSVVNTFTYGDINIELDETDTGDNDNDPNTNQYKMIPGEKITKDPVITVKQGSEEMWLFVKLEKSANFDDFMAYEVDSNWAQLSLDAEGNPVSGVYFRHITAEEVADTDMLIPVIQDNTVTVKDTVTKEMLNALDPANAAATYPTLTVTAYAVQKAGNPTAADAWAKVTAATPPTP